MCGPLFIRTIAFKQTLAMDDIAIDDRHCCCATSPSPSMGVAFGYIFIYNLRLTRRMPVVASQLKEGDVYVTA